MSLRSLHLEFFPFPTRRIRSLSQNSASPYELLGDEPHFCTHHLYGVSFHVQLLLGTHLNVHRQDFFWYLYSYEHHFPTQLRAWALPIMAATRQTKPIRENDFIMQFGHWFFRALIRGRWRRCLVILVISCVWFGGWESLRACFILQIWWPGNRSICQPGSTETFTKHTFTYSQP